MAPRRRDPRKLHTTISLVHQHLHTALAGGGGRRTLRAATPLTGSRLACACRRCPPGRFGGHGGDVESILFSSRRAEPGNATAANLEGFVSAGRFAKRSYFVAGVQ